MTAHAYDIVFLAFLLPCVSAFIPAPPAISSSPSVLRLPVTQATAGETLTDDVAVPPLPGQPQMVKDAIAARNANMMKEETGLLDKSMEMKAQVQEIKAAQTQAAAATEPEPFYRQPVLMGSSIAGLLASMFGAVGLVLHRRKAGERRAMLAANTAAAHATAAAIVLAGATPAFAGNAANGEQVFSGNCAACHAGGNNVIQAEKTLKKAALTEYLQGGFKEESIVYQVTNGKNAMPAFGGRLSDEEIADVAAYVYKTSNADSWE